MKGCSGRGRKVKNNFSLKKPKKIKMNKFIEFFKNLTVKNYKRSVTTTHRRASPAFRLSLWLIWLYLLVSSSFLLVCFEFPVKSDPLMSLSENEVLNLNRRDLQRYGKSLPYPHPWSRLCVSSPRSPLCLPIMDPCPFLLSTSYSALFSRFHMFVYHS